jgi:UDP-galactopyranose mutase
VARYDDVLLGDSGLDLLCFSHLRWDFVFQRPQHLMTRIAKNRRVYFIEEPIFGAECPELHVRQGDTGVTIVTPQIPHGIGGHELDTTLQRLISDFIDDYAVTNFVSWYYTPMALKFTRHLRPSVMVYDCMDELSHFKGAPPELIILERELFSKVDVVFTGGVSLFESKRTLHSNVHAFPSSVDCAHFGLARDTTIEPADQAHIPFPRIGFAGVIDERLDIALLDECARRRPHYHFVMIGPVVKIDPATLPQQANIHYLGSKSYQDLPSYMAGWQMAMLPFARNDATKFISPTKTPEYLAAGKPVVSTSIRDVVRPYGDRKLVHIADASEDFVNAIDVCMTSKDKSDWLGQVDALLSLSSWDKTYEKMWQQIILAHHTQQLNQTYNKFQTTVPQEKFKETFKETLTAVRL